MFGVIRVANKLIEQFPNIKNGTEKELNDLLGQAYFLRGLCHFNLCRYFGGMPYIDYVIGADDSWDLPRESSYETYTKAAADLQIAYEHFAKAGIMRRNTPENLNPGKIALMYPNGCIALAVRARALLYAASPLSNQNGTADWEAAAEAAGQALQAAIDNRYELLPIDYYTTNHTGGATTNEILWGYYISQAANVQNMAGLLSQCQSDYSGKKGASGLHPTQNFVDRFETADGYLLRTEADRQKAAAAGSYNEQNPYANRDPRLYETVLVPRESFPSGVVGDYNGKTYIDTWVDGAMDYDSGNFGNLADDAATRYRKFKWMLDYSGGKMDDKMIGVSYIRLAEMYLIYAEALAETGDLKGALDQVHVVRSRVGLGRLEDMNPELRLTSDKDALINEILRERNCEIGAECADRLYDMIRRKRQDLFTRPLHGINVYRLDENGQRMTGADCRWDPSTPWPKFEYEKVRISVGARRWWDEGYWTNKWYLDPVSRIEIQKGYGLTQNPGW